MGRFCLQLVGRGALLALLILATACSDDQDATDGGAGDGVWDSDGSPAADPGPLDDGGDRPQGTDIPICDEVSLAASPLTNLLLVVDKSDSMNDPTAGAVPGRTKVMDIRDAVGYLLDEFEGKIRFGWMAFPHQDKCDPGVVSVPLADDSAPLIRGLVDAFLAWGGTPTGQSLQNADQYLQDTERDNFVLLVTDGMPTCPNGDGSNQNQADSDLALQAVESLYARGIDTFVVGLGEDLNSANPQLLNDMAVAGGRPRADAVKYHPASSLDELKAIFDEVGKAIFSCTMSLEVIPEKPDWIWVYFDGVAVPRDGTQQNGFDYHEAENQIVFYGPACESLQKGEVSTIEVKMGCAPPT